MERIKINTLIIFVLLCFTVSCTRNHLVDSEEQNLFNPLNKSAEYYCLKDLSGWENSICSIEDNYLNFNTDNDYSGGFYQYRKYIEDTVYKMSFELYTSTSDTIFLPIDFYKRYEDEDYQYLILFGKESDTLFSYKAFLYDELYKFFISGKYYYQFRFKKLTIKQELFYNIHEDSLKLLNGNDLPPLPEVKDNIN